MNKSGSREFTHVYVAKCGRFTKIGATTDVAGRIRALAAAKKGTGRLVRAWAHVRAYEVEGTAIWLMVQEHKREQREWFRAPVKAAVAAVEKAVEMVDAGKVGPFTRGRARQQKALALHEEYAATMERLRIETEAWIEANPEEYAKICAQMGIAR